MSGCEVRIITVHSRGVRLQPHSRLTFTMRRQEIRAYIMLTDWRYECAALLLALLVSGCDGSAHSPGGARVQRELFPSGKVQREYPLKAGLSGQDVVHGLVKEWNEDGELIGEYQFVDGVQHGISRTYWPDGQLADEVTYVDGKMQGLHTRWYAPECMAARGNNVDGKMHGTWTYWYTNGQLSRRAEFRHGVLHGRDEGWHPNGQKQCERMFESGQAHGIWREWNEDGELVKEEVWEHGVLVEAHPPVSPVATAPSLGRQSPE